MTDKGIPKRMIRIAVVQFDAKIGEVEKNIALARELCTALQPGTVDLVCLPEMSFTGYNFNSSSAILPYLELPGQGPTSLFCKELAQKVRCHVVAGYPELLPSSHDDASHPESLPGANSAIVYTPSGDVLVNYRKTNLFETDVVWSISGTGFVCFDLPIETSLEQKTTIRVALGICMDLNAAPVPLPNSSNIEASAQHQKWAFAPWTIEEGPYEIADYCIANKADALVMLNAWLASEQDATGAEQDASTEEEEEPEPDWYVLRFWGTRLRPLWIRNPAGAVEEDCSATIVVMCNRTGTENGKTFAGSSSIFSMRHQLGKPKLLHYMGKKEVGIKLWTIRI